MRLFGAGIAVVAALASLTSSLVGAMVYPKDNVDTNTLITRDNTRYVFAHFMIGIVGDRTSAADYDADMQRAKSYGIDAFALNIGTDSYTDQQLGYAYDSAANNGMKVFISFDFNWWSTGSSTQIGQKVAQYAGKPGQLMVDGKAFVSSFIGDGLDVNAMRNAAGGTSIYFAPNFHPGTDFSTIDGALNWMGWPSNGNNKAPRPGQSVSVQQGDQSYQNALGGKGYIAPASPWFFTHYGPEVSYSKNWLFPGELLWYQRWQQLLTLGPRFVEIITWNDYGESHYVGPLSSKHTDDGASKWVNDMPHDGWLDMAKPFIAAYKAGSTNVNNYISSDQLIYWYRPQPNGVDCSATDTCMAQANNASGNYFIGRPDGYQDVSDSIFVVSLLKSAATLQVTSGSNSVQSFSVPAGASSYSVPMGVGAQKFLLTRNSQTVLSGTSLKDVINGCVCGLWNYNAYVGTLPATFNDALSGDGYANFHNGLKASCAATPSLGTNPVSSTFSTTTKPPTTTPSAFPTTTKPPTPTTTTKPPTPTSGSGSGSGSGPHCVGGTGPDNYAGLCSFCCHYDYCPAGPCACTSSSATAVPTPPTTGTKGVPKDGEDQSYAGLCSFACNHGYCPDTACKVVN